MKIGIVCPYDLTLGGGVQEHVLAQAAELQRRGHQVRIITPKPWKLNGSLPDNVIFVGNSRTVRAANTRPQLSISVLRDEVDDMLAAEAFDILHIHEPELPMIGAQILAKAQCPVVGTFHAFHPETPIGKTIETLRTTYSKTILNRLSAMTAVSDAAAAFVQQRTKQKVAIVPNGIDLPKYQVHHKGSAKPTILYIGRLEKRKGVRYLLKAFAELQKTRPETRLVIAGDGDLRVGLEDFVAVNNLKHVTFKGYVTEVQKLKLLSEADVFCSPALYGESFGIVLLEAMAAGLPIVAGDNPGYSTVMTNQGKLSLVNPTDTQDFARRLDIFLYNEPVRQLWLKWAKQHVKQFVYPKVVDQYEAIYRQLYKK